jgi:putative endonuclease
LQQGLSARAFGARSRRQKTVVSIESHDTAPDAIEREKQLKRWRREKKIALIEAANPEWLDLSSEVL